MGMTARSAAIIIGIVFLVIGVLGFIPNPLVSATGLFQVNTAHNLVHLVSGAVLLIGAYSALGPSLALKIIGIVYGLVAVLGLIMGGGTGMLLGIIHVNGADHWLHVVLAIVILYAGFALPDDRMSSSRAM